MTQPAAGLPVVDRPRPDGPPPGHAAGVPDPADAGLAARCAAAAAEVAAGRCRGDRLAAAVEVLDAALARVARRDARHDARPDRDLVVGGTAGDTAGDLLVALSAAGLDPADRIGLEARLAGLLRAAASALPDVPTP